MFAMNRLCPEHGGSNCPAAPAGAATPRCDGARAKDLIYTWALFCLIFMNMTDCKAMLQQASHFQWDITSSAGGRRRSRQVAASPTAVPAAPPVPPSHSLSSSRRRRCCTSLGCSSICCSFPCAGSRPSLQYDSTISIWHALNNCSSSSDCTWAGRRAGRQGRACQHWHIPPGLLLLESCKSSAMC